jgi:hypothetical protein
VDIGAIYGLPIPEEAVLHIGVHRMTGEHIDALMEQAIKAGLAVTPTLVQGSKWIEIGQGAHRVVLFAPEDYNVRERHGAMLKRCGPNTRIVDIPNPAEDALEAATGGTRR